MQLLASEKCVHFECIVFLLFFFIFYIYYNVTSKYSTGWSSGAMVLGKLPVPGRPTNLD